MAAGDRAASPSPTKTRLAKISPKLWVRLPAMVARLQIRRPAAIRFRRETRSARKPSGKPATP